MNKAEVQSLFAKLGGIRPLGKSKRFHPLNDEDINHIEQMVHSKLPRDYVEFLKEFGGVSFRKLLSFSPISQLPTTVEGGTEPFNNLYGGQTEGINGIITQIQIYHGQGRIPQDLVPIGDNLFGDHVCICIKGKDCGKVFFWDHEDERSEQDYWDLHGPKTPVPREFLYGNIYLVASSFDDFLRRLVKDENS